MGTNGAHSPASLPNEAGSERSEETEPVSADVQNPDPASQLPGRGHAEISRQNGSKSRGPKTGHGKNRSRQNAYKHGLSAETLLLQISTEEEKAVFQSLRERFEQEFPVRTIEEQVMLENVVLAVWQRRRCLQFEARELRQEFIFHGPIMDRILRYSAAVDKRLFRALEQLKRLREENISEPSENDSDANEQNRDPQ
jgi:hypothetical protein